MCIKSKLVAADREIKEFPYLYKSIHSCFYADNKTLFLFFLFHSLDMIRIHQHSNKSRLFFPRYHSTTARSSQSSVGIRRENKSRWERRSALTPNTVKQLIQETGTTVYVQPSTKRIFTNESYEKVNVDRERRGLDQNHILMLAHLTGGRYYH